METASKPQPASCLVVDDHQRNRFAMREVLRQLDADVVDCGTGADALAAMEAQRFAVVLLDVQMPVMDGYETAERIRDNEDKFTTPIIFMTAIHKDPASEMKGYSYGAADYLFKPVNPVAVASKVKVFLDLFEQEQTVAQPPPDIELLANVLQMCADCHKIRDANDQWHRLEAYIESKQNVQVSHGWCPSCARGYQNKLQAIKDSQPPDRLPPD